ncbi:hypothetical protein UK23_13260 [Lentzea aerocolonigenes]|uniref:Uncharacterized protein n=1 Tax=Lentzea aerocolonigenes TaxID=68170 RepID=A0A0F0H2G0_LENAE|nr:hypothetical protein [Lentzea aerocolonigenes]KJK49705.1 hypothetical protein UK23_13260 [Lentzea aerocolonigenes]
MRPAANLALQLAALTAAVVLRMRWGGLETLFFMMTVIGPVLALVPTMLAIALLRSRVLSWHVWVPFAGMSAGTLLASLFFGGDKNFVLTWIPALELLGVSGPRSEWVGLTDSVGMAGLCAFPVFLVWALAAIFVFNRPRAASVERTSP